MEKRWLLQPQTDPYKTEQLASELNINTFLSSLLIRRGIEDFESAKHFFRPNLQNTHNPFLLKNMTSAVKRVLKAIHEKQHIFIYGDYDVDGTTAVAMMFLYLKKFTSNLSYYIPDRYSEGYGVSEKGIRRASELKAGLIITLDCGIKAIEKIALANSLNIDVIVCDHHLPGLELPEAIILNPKQIDCPSPFKELSGAGVGFKLIQALQLEQKLPIENTLEFLDLLAISIGADMVSITDENRVFAQLGLEKLNKKPNIGIAAILAQAKVNRTINMRDIGFLIGPRINAAGRIDHAEKAVELLIADSADHAALGSEDVHLDNADRQILDAQTTKEALAILHSDEQHQSKCSTIVYSDHWNKGIIGIVASKLQEHYYRPTIVLTKNEEYYTGSARSIKGFHLYNAINEHKHLLESFGGHAFAAGLTIHESNLALFISEFEKTVSLTLKQEDLIPTLEIELELDISEITYKFFRILNQFEPFGQDNPQPIFVSHNVKALPGIRVLGKDHLKLELTNEENTAPRISAIAFKQANRYNEICNGRPFSIAYNIELNEWNGKRNLQLNIKDIKTFTNLRSNQ